MRIDQKVRELGYYTITDAAKLIGKSPDTVRRWIKVGIYEPQFYAEFGSLEVVCFDWDDIMRMRRIAKTIKPGAKRQPPPTPLALVC